MIIPKEQLGDVMEDLASLYLTGEAAPGTRALVESYARQDPAFGQRLRAAQNLRLPEPPPADAPDAGIQALKQTRQYIALRTIFSAMGIAFSLLPLSFAFGDGGVRFLFLRSQPGLVQAFWSIAVASWVAMWLMHKEIRKRGL